MCMWACCYVVCVLFFMVRGRFLQFVMFCFLFFIIFLFLPCVCAGERELERKGECECASIISATSKLNAMGLRLSLLRA